MSEVMATPRAYSRADVPKRLVGLSEALGDYLPGYVRESAVEGSLKPLWRSWAGRPVRPPGRGLRAGYNWG